VARSVLRAIVERGDYCFLALDQDRGATAFRSEIATGNQAALKANLARVQGSATTDAQ
jgi:hypothetical protein